MKCNDSLLYFFQELTFNLVDLISHIEYKDFVMDSLKLANQSLDQDSKICPDLLYSRLENMDEKDILTFMELDNETNPLVWSCIANYFVLVWFAIIRISILEKSTCPKQLKVWMWKR